MSDLRPNIIFIMSDDHAAHAMSCYGSRINETPNLDRIAAEGVRADNCFCTNSVCTPSRAAILGGTYNHVNGVMCLGDHPHNSMDTFPKRLQAAGYQAAIYGKWHLGTGPDHEPAGFDDWCVLPGQGDYHNPEMIDSDGRKVHEGYVTDIITDLSLDWLRDRDADRPFCLLCYHKAPHRAWEPDDKHKDMYKDVDIPIPETFNDDYATRAAAAGAAEMRVDRDMQYCDLKVVPPEGAAENDFVPLPSDEELKDFSLTTDDGETVTFTTRQELREWKYQRYIKDYLRVVASVDDNVGRVLDYLDEAGLRENTIVVYTSDQGFFLGDHNWYDKRFMYEESLRMPFIVRYPKEIAAGSTVGDMLLNVDFAQTFLDYAGVAAPDHMQGHSFRGVLVGDVPEDWRTSMYYRYWQQGGHNVYAHYGVRTRRYKLIYYYADGLDMPHNLHESLPEEWELFDLDQDASEIRNVYDDPAYASVVKELKQELHRLMDEVGDERYEKDVDE
jgi:arylsulfatase A-like enzyme